MMKGDGPHDRRNNIADLINVRRNMLYMYNDYEIFCIVSQPERKIYIIDFKVLNDILIKRYKLLDSNFISKLNKHRERQYNRHALGLELLF